MVQQKSIHQGIGLEIHSVWSHCPVPQKIQSDIETLERATDPIPPPASVCIGGHPNGAVILSCDVDHCIVKIDIELCVRCQSDLQLLTYSQH